MIKVADGKAFDRLLRKLADDVVNSSVHWSLLQTIHNVLIECPLVRVQSPTFWALTIRAHETTAIAALCRVYDQDRSSLHLQSWLRTIRDNLGLFSRDRFAERLRNSQYVENLVAHRTEIDLEQLGNDIASCTLTDDLVKRLFIFRSQVFAHKNALAARDASAPPDHQQVTTNDIESLILRARTLLNRYSNMFSAETFSVKMVGGSDVETLVRTLQKAVAPLYQRT